MILPEIKDPYRRAECFELIAEQLKLALKQLARRTMPGGFPCWCELEPAPPASDAELAVHEGRCEAVTKAWIRAGHAGVGASPPVGAPIVYDEPPPAP